MFQLLLLIIYLSFISLGLPDSVLGAAWPAMYREFSMPVSYAGILSMIIAAGTILSSLLSDRLTRKLGTGKVTALSVLLTAVSLLGFSVSHSFWLLCLWAVPYGLGAGSVDASLNNYVALHYASRHMSWLHCMWGVGASVGPYIMGRVLVLGLPWNLGYRFISILQFALAAAIGLSLPLWSRRGASGAGSHSAGGRALSLREILRIPGAKEVMLTFFCYCSIEQSAGLWVTSYFVLYHGVSAEAAAGCAGLFFAGMTIGRALSGFLTLALSDAKMVRLGQGLILAGLLCFLLPFGKAASFGGVLLIGLGCAPIYPCIIHSTPQHFGADKSQAVIGVQMASAYVGTCLMPPLFGVISERVSIALLPAYLLGLLVLMVFMHERLLHICENKKIRMTGISEAA